MDKNFDHKQQEEKIISTWEKSGVFAAPTKSAAEAKGQKPFTIIMPPPNASDPLHVGHTMFVTIEDVLIRYHRMLGDATLWLPGTDHAGIETQFVFEKKLSKQGKSRYDFDRKTLYQMISDYVAEFSGVSVAQMKRLGASADWSRFKFTLDGDVVAYVLNTFEKLYKDGLIYRGERLVNYCIKCGTSYSELEVEYEEKNDPLYYIKYGPFVLATVRPETKFGDTAVAVHPGDKRYEQWIGKEIEVEGLNGKFKLKVIGDELVDPEFGTGVVKVTPAHDPNDFDMGQRHGLPVIQVIGLNGKLTEVAGKYAGLSVFEARKLVVEDLKVRGLIEKVDEKYVHRIGTCYRCHSVIEPLPLAQFFVKTKPLAEKALAALEKGETVVLGAGRDKILTNWLTNLKDWNISRQIVWGIQIPVWYDSGKNPEMTVGFLNKDGEFERGKFSEMLKLGHSLTEIEAGLQTLRPTVGSQFIVSKTKPGEGFLQETDTFDTWFSSGQWSTVTLTTSKPGDLDFYYPTAVIESGYDILTIWIMRMMLLSIYLDQKGRSPFKYVYLHGLIRDEQGRKMSKSIGNVVNPLDLVEKYGADALRMALVMSTTPGNDSNVGEPKVRGMRNFSNKIWNAARYIANITSEESMRPPSEEIFSGDEEFKNKLKGVVGEVTGQLESLKIGLAAETVYNEFWHWFCDEAIEAHKNLRISDAVLMDGLRAFLKLLHPFVPFVTEAVWQDLFPNEGLLAASSWPIMD